MLVLAHRVLHYLGATEVININGSIDPSNEQEFLALEFKSPTLITWDMYSAAFPVVETTIGTKLLRAERNRRIAKTDWVMTVDNAESLANKADWIAYRQALRDLPENPPAFVWNGPELDFSNMTMPVEPPVIRTPPSSVSQQSSESTQTTLPTPPTPSESDLPE